jgi:misacylated tRNA(Ala) deacylase
MLDAPPATELLYATDAYRSEFHSTVLAIDPAAHAIALGATAFFPTGGGQPHDTGALRFGERTAEVIDVTKASDGIVWHKLDEAASLPRLGQRVGGVLDWERRYLVMRLHTAQHIMNGIIWRDHHAYVTGAQISPPEARLDFELPTISREFAQTVERAINFVVAENLPVRVLWLPRVQADRDPSLIRIKANLIPRSIDPLRVIDIVGLDRQADGGTHVASTAEVGRVRVLKTESKGRANKRVRIALRHRLA